MRNPNPRWMLSRNIKFLEIKYSLLEFHAFKRLYNLSNVWVDNARLFAQKKKKTWNFNNFCVSISYYQSPKQKEKKKHHHQSSHPKTLYSNNNDVLRK